MLISALALLSLSVLGAYAQVQPEAFSYPVALNPYGDNSRAAQPAERHGGRSLG